jgi:hypothetical protein
LGNRAGDSNSRYVWIRAFPLQSYSLMKDDRVTGPVGSGMTFNQLLALARDFNMVPRLLSMTQLLDLFSAVNIAEE